MRTNVNASCSKPGGFFHWGNSSRAGTGLGRKPAPPRPPKRRFRYVSLSRNCAETCCGPDDSSGLLALLQSSVNRQLPATRRTAAGASRLRYNTKVHHQGRVAQSPRASMIPHVPPWRLVGGATHACRGEASRTPGTFPFPIVATSSLPQAV
jgi:hypothetical protein